MSEGVALFALGTLVSILLAIGLGLLVNDIQQRRERGPFNTGRKSPRRLLEEYKRARRLHDDQVLLQLNIARMTIMGTQTIIVYAISILIAVWFGVFLTNLSVFPAWDNADTRTILLTVLGAAVLPILLKGILDVLDFSTIREDLTRLIDFDQYEAGIAARLAELGYEPGALEELRKKPRKR